MNQDERHAHASPNVAEKHTHAQYASKSTPACYGDRYQRLQQPRETRNKKTSKSENGAAPERTRCARSRQPPPARVLFDSRRYRREGQRVMAIWRHISQVIEYSTRASAGICQQHSG